MKLTFDKEDLKKFLIYAVVLFFVVSICISCLISIAQNGNLEHFNIFIAFSKDYIAGTFAVFALFLFGLFSSTKKKFFGFEKGFGISTEKKLDGYSKWCDAKTMKKELKKIEAIAPRANAGGIPLINDGKHLWVDDSEYHNLIIGSTGSGKTQTVIFPLVQVLAKHGESMIITDPKGEIYEKTSQMLRSRGYNIVLLNFRNPARGNAWNPLTLPYHLWKEGNQDKAIELLDDLALNILYDESNKNADPFWEKTSAGYFAGIALGLFEDAEEEQININSISLMTTVGEDKFRGSSTYIKEYFNSKDPSGAAYINASSTILSPSDTKGSILAVFKEKIKLFATRANLSEMLSHSDFNIQDIGLKKSALFIVIQDEKKTYHSLATILVKQIYETLIDVAQSHGGSLPIRTNFLLDEFANMPPLKDVTTMITAARSRAMRFTLIIQNFAQLNEVYGEQQAETIKGNCGNLVYLLSTEYKALEEISKMCGDVKVKDEDDKSASKPLVSITDLQKLKQFEVIIRRVRLAPFKTKLTPNFKINWGRKYPVVSINDVPAREIKELKTFNVKEFVDEKLKKNKDNILDFAGGSGGALPFFGGGLSGSNPFGGDSLPTTNPFMGGISSSPLNSMSEDKSFDVDDIVKKIDAKIAELEKEEELNNQNNSNNNDNMSSIINDTRKQEENNNNLEKIINESNDTTSIDRTDILDNIVNTNNNYNNINNNISNDVNSNINNANNFNNVNNNYNTMNNNVSNNIKETNDDEFFDDFFE